jgi:hypothetical protein
MFFLAELPHGCSLFPLFTIGVYTVPINLGLIHQIWNLDALRYNAFRCTDIRKGLDGQMEYLINDMWHVLRQEDGSPLGLFQVTQLLQATFADSVHVSAGKTKVPDAFWLLAQKIKDLEVNASSIAEAFFANDIMAIKKARQTARQKKGM